MHAKANNNKKVAFNKLNTLSENVYLVTIKTTSHHKLLSVCLLESQLDPTRNKKLITELNSPIAVL